MHLKPILRLVRDTSMKATLALLPGSTRTVADKEIPGHLVISGLQDSGSLVKQPGQEIAVTERNIA